MSKIGFKRSPTTSTRPGTTKRPRPAPPAYPALALAALDSTPFAPRRASSPSSPSEEKLAELHAAAFCALRSAVEANDDGLVRRMREWEHWNARRRSAPKTVPGRRRRRRQPSTSADLQLARALPLPPAGDDEPEDDDDGLLIIHTSPGAGLASCPPRPAPMAVDRQPQPAAAWPAAAPPEFTNSFTGRRIAADPSATASAGAGAPGQRAHTYVAYRNSSSCTSSSDDEDMVWESSSSPYLSAVTPASSSDVEDDDDDDDDDEREDRHVAELGFAFAAGCGAIQDYSVDAILALQAAGRP